MKVIWDVCCFGELSIYLIVTDGHCCFTNTSKHIFESVECILYNYVLLVLIYLRQHYYSNLFLFMLPLQFHSIFHNYTHPESAINILSFGAYILTLVSSVNGV